MISLFDQPATAWLTSTHSAPARRAADRSSHAAGFSMIEMLVVLTIISLLLTLVPAATGALRSVQFRHDVRAFAGTLRELQATAFGTGYAVIMTIDMKDRSWRSSVEPRSHAVPPSIEDLRIRFLTGRDANSPLRFLPDGSISAATLILTGAGHESVIRIDGLLGSIHLDE